MEKEVYILLTQGNDGKFTMGAYRSFEEAAAALDKHIDAQRHIEARGAEVYVDDHSFERFDLPGFVLEPGAVVSHVTFNALVNGKVIKTERYILRLTMR